MTTDVLTAEQRRLVIREALSVAAAYPEAHETIDGLAQRGLLMALLSNADEDFLQSALSRARLRFSIIQSSESLRAYKPHRAIFLALCERSTRPIKRSFGSAGGGPSASLLELAILLVLAHLRLGERMARMRRQPRRPCRST